MKKTEKEFILTNYSSLGGKKCAEILNLKAPTIITFANRNGLKINSDALKSIRSSRSLNNWKNYIKKEENYKVNPNFFINCDTPESAYILGLLWADGTIYKDTITIECLEADMCIFQSAFLKSGIWGSYIRKGRISGKNMQILKTSNKKLADFLRNNDYQEKSLKSPNKILSLIPKNIRPYFFRGWIDGDGCFYLNEKHYCKQFYISGSFEQDWYSFEELCFALDIKFKIVRIKKKTKYSALRITNKKDINLLGDYIFQFFSKDNIGLLRKYEKYCNIIK